MKSRGPDVGHVFNVPEIPRHVGNVPPSKIPMARLTPTDLPAYSQSLLRIPVAVVVTLAQQRQSLGRVVELGPGSILRFDKSCDEMLELHIGGRPIALGEAGHTLTQAGFRHCWHCTGI